MVIIDAHTHEPSLKGPGLSALPLDDERRMEAACEASLAAMDAIGIDMALLLARAEWAEFAAAAHPGRFASNIRFDPTDPDIENLVSTARNRRGVVGLQAYLSWPPSGENIQLLRAGGFEAMFSAAEKHRLPVSAIVSGDLPEIAPVAEAHPDLILVIPHFGLKQPPLREPDVPPFAQLDQLLDLARYPNVFVKCSGIPTLSATGFPYPDVWPHILKVIGAFGPGRVMWASDYTRVSKLMSYEHALAYLRDTTELSTAEKTQLLGGTAAKVFGLPAGRQELERDTTPDDGPAR
jgi:L-fuconolactonase